MSVIWKIDPNYKYIFTHAQILFSSGIWTALPVICSLTPTYIIQHLGVCRVLGLCQPWTSQEKIGHGTVPLREEVSFLPLWKTSVDILGQRNLSPNPGDFSEFPFHIGAVISLGEHRGTGLDSLAWFLCHHHLFLSPVWMKMWNGLLWTII